MRDEEQRPDVSVVVPALNEERTVHEVVERVLALPLTVQLIVVNDGSTDRTGEILRDFGSRITVVTTLKPSGKGAALRKGFERVTGRVVIIQDADLEYRPEEIPGLVAPILEGRTNVVFGNRFHHGLARTMALPNKIVNVMLAWTVRAVFGARIQDEATCYKAFRSDLLPRMDLRCKRFEFCPEVTAKLLRMGETILEVPISYEPRTKNAGKKIRWWDAPDAFLTLLRYRFWRSPVAARAPLPVLEGSE